MVVANGAIQADFLSSTTTLHAANNVHLCLRSLRRQGCTWARTSFHFIITPVQDLYAFQIN